MKTTLLFLSFIVLASCASDTEPDATVAPADSVAVEAPSSGGTTPAPISSTRTYGQSILDGTTTPSGNKETIACLDSLFGITQDTRDFFFDVYLSISGKSEGVLGETASEKALAYLEQFPKEAITNYNSLEKSDKEIFAQDLAFEFYASGGNIAADVNECIDNIQTHCKECAADEKALEDLRLDIIKRANKLKAS